MKFAFVSLMNGVAWGGSEELWYRTAKLVLTRGNTVYTLTKKWPTVPAKVAELQKLGANTEFYYEPEYSRAARIKIKFKLKKYVRYVVPDIAADLYIFSFGTTFDFIFHQYIIDEIIKPGRPYIFISQHNVESGNLIIGSQRAFGINLMQNAIQFLFVSERNLITAQRQIAHAIPNAQLISNPINIKKTGIKSYPASPRLLMACVARLDCSFKGQDILLQALSGKPWKNRNFSLKFYGTGPHQEHLQELILMFDLQDKVTVEGHVNDIDLIWENNQVLVLPSISEGTPLALIEAMLSGRAALATDVGDNGKYVLNGNTGFLADWASVKCLSVALEELWQQKENLREMGEKAYEHALQITDLDPVQTLMNLIEVHNKRLPVS